MNKFVTVKIPEAVANTIDELINNHKELGYTSRAQVVIDGVRKIVRESKKGCESEKRKKSEKKKKNNLDDFPGED